MRLFIRSLLIPIYFVSSLASAEPRIVSTAEIRTVNEKLKSLKVQKANEYFKQFKSDAKREEELRSYALSGKPSEAVSQLLTKISLKKTTAGGRQVRPHPIEDVITYVKFDDTKEEHLGMPFVVYSGDRLGASKLITTDTLLDVAEISTLCSESLRELFRENSEIEITYDQLQEIHNMMVSSGKRTPIQNTLEVIDRAAPTLGKVVLRFVSDEDYNLNSHFPMTIDLIQK